MSSPKKSEHYVNNKDFLAALIDYRSDVELSFLNYMVENPPKKREQRGGKPNQSFQVTLENVF